MRPKFMFYAAMAATILAATATAVRADDWNKTYQLHGRATLRIGTDDGDVTITAGDQKQIDVHVMTEGYKIGPGDVRIDESQNGDSVTVNVKTHGWSMWGHRKSLHIDVRVPRELDLDVHTGDGTVNAEQMSGKIRIDTGDGNVSANGLKGDVSMHTGDGNVSGTHLDGALDIMTGDGHIVVDGRFDTLNLKTGDGSIEAKVWSGSKVANSWRLHSGDGHINLWLPGDFGADLDAHTGDCTSCSMCRSAFRAR
jgi:DUF4097 and DUF4098 domain-containing protein YvlB